MAVAYYGDRISPHMTDTPEGYLICHDVPIARTGPQDYLARELQLDGDPERVLTVNRYPEDVFEGAAIASFEGKPVTDGHPPENVGPENYAAYTKGHIQNVRQQGDYIVADLYINDANLANEVRNKVKREVSCGYLCNYAPDGMGYKQQKIRGNHVAVVPRGRAGAAVAIQDATPEVEKGRESKMNKLAHGILSLFGSAAKDASPDELDKMVEATATALDAVPAEQAQEAEPAKEEATDEVVYKEQKGVDLGTKADRILELLERMNQRYEERIHDESDLDQMIAKLSGKKEDGDGSSVTIPVEEADACTAGPARDAAIQLLRRVRPAVAAIEDKAARAKVTDALLSAIQSKDVMGDIARAATDSAQVNANQSKKTTYEQMCAESEANYAALNPHKIQKEAR